MSRTHHFIPKPLTWLRVEAELEAEYPNSTYGRKSWTYREGRYYRGLRTNGYHRYHKAQATGVVRRWPVDPTGDALHPYTRKRVRYDDD